ncbi:anaerobic carbon-monoxide dehydrogenase catalytic subunit [Deferrisoma camini]|uniref:anaerobic carbon-monoxide dehydrogenase catalytic subunit n=1 Tax=Deferrisoma camini TaxID=1035120 RepID=UPI00046CCC8C|nr:anaerobic carbon-monoxide dehydrogenase catalytic subunit [Deferrisoma camini]
MAVKIEEARELTVTQDAPGLIDKARTDGVATVWDRHEAQKPRCGYCDLGLSCRICAMGPCRIDPFGEGPQQGVCGADADIMVARNLGRMIAAGSASHSDHGRDLVETLLAVGEGRAPGYTIADEGKLRALAAEFGIGTEGKSSQDLARELADAMLEEFGMKKGRLQFVDRMPAARVAVWEKLGILPRGIDREVTEMMHRTHMGVDNDYVNILLHGFRTALADGLGGSMIGTELSDVLFGVPKPTTSQANLGVIRPDQVNILLHGHNPVVSEMVARAVEDPELVQRARDAGAAGINLVGLCCTGNELLMRRGIPMAGNHLMTELVLVTGAVDMMIVDYQCIMPALPQIAGCYHTKFVSTSPKAKFPGAEHREFTPENAEALAREVVREAVDNYRSRKPGAVAVPSEPVAQMTGFSVEAVLAALGGTPQPLIDAITAGKIRGAVGVVGCNNPKVKHDLGHVELTRRLIEHDVLVLDTGCAAVANAKAGFKVPEAADLAGPGLREVCGSLGIPPVLHVGSCVDNTRILHLAGALANALNVDTAQLPLAGAAPEWYSEKAVAIAFYVVAAGITTFLGVVPPILGSPNVVKLATQGLDEVIGARFVVEPDPARCADAIVAHIDGKRKALGL